MKNIFNLYKNLYFHGVNYAFFILDILFSQYTFFYIYFFKKYTRKIFNYYKNIK